MRALSAHIGQGIAPNSGRRPVLMLVLIAVALCSTYSYSSGQCPFDPEDAIPDTLDPLGYYPLEIGNEWHYESFEGLFRSDPWREEILSDTIIDGKRFYHWRRTEYELFGRRITRIRKVSDSYLRVENDRILFHDDTTRIRLTNFSAPFNSCYKGDDLYWLGLVLVTGEYNTAFTFSEYGTDVEYVVPARKFFENIAGGEIFLYGIGLVAAGTDGGGSELAYARVASKEYGTPLDSTYIIDVSSEGWEMTAKPGFSQVSVYPNPAGRFIDISTPDFQAGIADIIVYDVLGRIVMRQEAAPGQSGIVRLYTSSLAPGIYALHLRFISGHVLTGSFAIASMPQ